MDRAERASTIGVAAAVFVSAVALNFGWELLQCSLYIMPADTGSLWWHCLRASLGDAVLILLIWAIGWLILRRPLWFETPGIRGYALMIASGLVIAALVEWVSVHLLRRWTYGPAMPIVPVLRIGVLPLLQLALLSPLVYWLASLVARWQRPAEGPATTIPLSRRSRRRDVP